MNEKIIKTFETTTVWIRPRDQVPDTGIFVFIYSEKMKRNRWNKNRTGIYIAKFHPKKTAFEIVTDEDDDGTFISLENVTCWAYLPEFEL